MVDRGPADTQTFTLRSRRVRTAGLRILREDLPGRHLRIDALAFFDLEVQAGFGQERSRLVDALAGERRNHDLACLQAPRAWPPRRRGRK